MIIVVIGNIITERGDNPFHKTSTKENNSVRITEVKKVSKIVEK